MNRQISSKFSYQSRFIDVLGSKLHYIDEGAGEPVLFLHGNPTSSYLWRNVLPDVTSNHRAIAVDLIGMGRSDKLRLPYRFFDHVRYLDAFIQTLGLENITLVLHDWGSALGFHYARRNEGNVRGIAFVEAILRPSRWQDFPLDYKIAFKLFRTPGIGWLVISVGNIFIKKLLPTAVVRSLSPEEMAHYAAPFPTIASRRAVRQWPREIPIDGKPADVHAAVQSYSEWLRETDLPKLMLVAKPGAIMSPSTAKWAEENFPNLTKIEIGRGLHFVQEDNPDGIGAALTNWLGRL